MARRTASVTLRVYYLGTSTGRNPYNTHKGSRDSSLTDLDAKQVVEGVIGSFWMTPSW